MAQDASAHEHSPAHPLERLIFFSDAVFAIAITLLIIEIHPPHLHYGASTHDQLVGFFSLAPQFIGFLISFGVIGAFWVGHHRSFSLARHWSPRLLFPNLALLCMVVIMPFATAYMNANMWQLVPTVFYGCVLMITGLFNIWLVRRVTHPPVVAEEADGLVIARTRSRGWAVVIGGALCTALAFVDPHWSQPSLATIPIWLRLLVRNAERRYAAGQAEG